MCVSDKTVDVPEAQIRNTQSQHSEEDRRGTETSQSLTLSLQLRCSLEVFCNQDLSCGLAARNLRTSKLSNVLVSPSCARGGSRVLCARTFFLAYGLFGCHSSHHEQ